MKTFRSENLLHNSLKLPKTHIKAHYKKSDLYFYLQSYGKSQS